MGLLKDTYADLYGERFDTNPAYTDYDCMAEGALHISLRARTLSEAEDTFAELLDNAESEVPGLVLRLRWVDEQ
ncbi:hypothetical protein [Eubacterium sp. 1001713B170207_170306_E7]|uniref:hypothetical protein n=1 Tax=Eubacterium sp. 1001713B170207_170306_E7 TaxID=2787097 RepID=UPI00189B40F0|nr:hypothetical protein [Eubacterium sp. 1001713B170207_170306_E7]